MKKRDLIISALAIFFFGMAVISISYQNFFYYGIFLGLALGTAFFMQSKGIVVAAAGFIIYDVSLFKLESAFLPKIGTVVLIGGLCFSLYEILSLKGKIRREFLRKEHLEQDADVEVSWNWSLGVLPIAWKTFGFFFAPSKTAILIRAGTEENLYFYDFWEKEFYEPKEKVKMEDIKKRSIFLAIIGIPIVIIAIYMILGHMELMDILKDIEQYGLEPVSPFFTVGLLVVYLSLALVGLFIIWFSLKRKS
ncbi:MAG: hypothetical protein HXS46_15430 [Theionarchaea archaeon]|nr:MAG: hypothetical protein AYK18_08400 [Theionarchaea archaeon DG-70]MBU7012075.1 hypothetical protein [Theionarchaea archaeon]